MSVNGTIPLKRHLLEPIEALQQASDMIGLLLVDEPFGLSDVDLFGELGVEKGCVDIDLVDLRLCTFTKASSR